MVQFDITQIFHDDNEQYEIKILFVFVYMTIVWIAIVGVLAFAAIRIGKVLKKV